MNQEQTNITTGKQIRHLRTQLGMTQEELAGELNVTRQALSNWERDVNEPDLNMLKKICFLFGVNMDDFAKEWSERNLPLTPDMVNEKSTKNVWWKCRTCGYEWKSVVRARAKGSLCPVCADRTVLAGYNDLATTDPELLDEWDYEKNTGTLPTAVSRNSMKIVWWKCSSSHSWRAKITDRTIEQKGCYLCEREFQSAFPQLLIMLYAVRNGLKVTTNNDKLIGINLDTYIPELRLAIEAEATTITEQRSQMVKEHICECNGIRYVKLKHSNDLIKTAQSIKEAFRKCHTFFQTNDEEDIEILRTRFQNWRKQK